MDTYAHKQILTSNLVFIMNSNAPKKQYPEGHFVGLWIEMGIAIFSGIGIPLSIATGNNTFIGVGPAIGVAFGLSIGQAVENKYKKEVQIRPLTETEKQRRKKITIAAISLLALGVLAFLVLLMLNK